MKNAGGLRCNALRVREKSRRRKNNGKQWKNNAKNNGNGQQCRRVPTSVWRQTPATASYTA
jgi:hypothetical protein